MSCTSCFKIANVRPGIVEVRCFRGDRGAGTTAKSPALVFDRYLSGLIEFGNLLAPSVRAVRRSMAAVRNTLLTFLNFYLQILRS